MVQAQSRIKTEWEGSEMPGRKRPWLTLSLWFIWTVISEASKAVGCDTIATDLAPQAFR